MPEFFYAAALGSDLADLINLENTLATPAHALPANAIPLRRPLARRIADGGVVRNGRINSALQFDSVLWEEFDAFMTAFFSGFDGDDDVAAVVSALDEGGHYSPFRVLMAAPVQGENYQIATGGFYVTGLTVPLYDCQLQRTERSANATITASERLTRVNTSGGSVTITLPAIATVGAYTIHSFEKSSASNNLVLDPPDALIDGAGSVTVTAIGRTDVYHDGAAWRTWER